MDAATSLTGYRRLGGVMFVLVFSGCTTTDTVMMRHPQTHEIARRELRVVAGSLAVQIQAQEMKTAKDLAGAFEAENKRPSEALIVLSNPLTLASRIQIAASAAKRRLPAMYLYRAHVEAGGLLSYGPNLPDMFRRCSVYAARVLGGAKPGELPLERPAKFEMVINLRSARALALAMPQSLLQRADQVIE
jgi:putative ABC transport system substrate-binding protein